MILKIKNKDTLIIGEFRFRCAIGKNGLITKKVEGDGCTPRGTFSLGKLYWRNDRVKKLNTKILSKKIKKNIGWCNDPSSNLYNREVSNNQKVRMERLYRSDYKYNYFIVINYNTKNIIKNIGSAIFLHLTKNYKKTAGCIAVSEQDFIVISKLLKKNSKIKI